MLVKQLLSKEAPEPGPYSQAIAIDHGLYFEVKTSGMCADFPMNHSVQGLDSPDDAEGQTTRALANLEGVLTKVGGDRYNITSVTVYLKDMESNWDAMNAAYKKFFRLARVLPTRAAVGVAEIPLPTEKSLVMISAEAYVPKEESQDYNFNRELAEQEQSMEGGTGTGK